MAVIEQDVRRATAAGLRLELAPLLHAEPVLLVDHDDAEPRERHALLDQRVGADDDRRHPRRDELEGAARARRGQRARQQLDRDRRVLEQRGERAVVLASQEVRRREQRALEAGARGGRERVGGDRRLARADVALEEPEHRRRAREVGAEVADRGVLVVASGATARSELSPERGLDARPAGSPSVGIVDRDRPRRIAPALPPPPDHARAAARAARRRRPGGAPRPGRSNDAG